MSAACAREFWLSGGRDVLPCRRSNHRCEHAPQVIDPDRLKQNRQSSFSLGEIMERGSMHLSHQDHRNLDIELAKTVQNAKRAETWELGLRNDEAAAGAGAGQ